MYCNIQLKHTHHTLNSFNNTESNESNEYLFRNDEGLILSENELIALLYTEFDIYIYNLD